MSMDGGLGHLHLNVSGIRQSSTSLGVTSSRACLPFNLFNQQSGRKRRGMTG
jgi:hypothetical protein